MPASPWRTSPAARSKVSAARGGRRPRAEDALRRGRRRFEVRGRPSLVAAVAVAVTISACKHMPGAGGADGSLPSAVRDGKALLESGQLAAALAELQNGPDDPGPP